MDELIVSGIAMAEWKRRHDGYNAAGAEIIGSVASVGGGGA